MSEVAESAPVSEPVDSIESTETSEVSEQPEVATPPAEVKKEEVKKRLKKLSLKIDGNEQEEELPFEIDDDPKAIEYMKKHLQMSKMANKRAQESATLQKQVMGFIEQLKKDPRKALSDPRIGVDIKKLAYEVLNEEVENSKKTPEQLEKEQMENEIKALREERAREKEEMQQRELERLQEQEYIRLDASFSKALEGSDLPKSPYVVKKMAEVMLVALESGIKVEPDQVLPIIRGEIIEDMKQMFAAMPAEAVSQILGKDLVGKIRKGNLAKAKEVQEIAKKKQVDEVSTKKKEETPVKKQTIKELFGI